MARDGAVQFSQMDVYSEDSLHDLVSLFSGKRGSPFGILEFESDENPTALLLPLCCSDRLLAAASRRAGER
jgi:hypothetical protein